MDDYYTLVEAAQVGSNEAYENLISQFQKIAYHQ